MAACAGGSEPGHDLVALDDALQTLATVDERKSRVVELRFFGGLSVEETASVLKVSVDTVMRDWKLAKAWLLREIKRGASWLALRAVDGTEVFVEPVEHLAYHDVHPVGAWNMATVEERLTLDGRAEQSDIGSDDDRSG